MARWEFVKQDHVKAYYVFKDGQAVCVIKYGRAIVGQIYTVAKNLHDMDGIPFTYLKEAKDYIKANY